MKKLYSLSIFTASILISASVPAEKINFNELTLPVPVDAYNLNRRNLKKDSFRQVDFSIDLDSKNRKVAIFYNELFKKYNWIQCQSLDEKNFWSDYLDFNGKKLSRAVEYFVDPSGEKMITIMINQGIDGLVSVENKKEKYQQNVSIMIYQVEIDQLISALGLNCDGNRKK